jgi:hypothetical protein
MTTFDGSVNHPALSSGSRHVGCGGETSHPVSMF